MAGDETKICTAGARNVALLWLAALLLFLLGVGERMAKPGRNKGDADPFFYLGIVSIAVATPVLLVYFVVRVSRAGAARRLAEPLGPESDSEWVSLMPGGLFTFKGKRETPAARARADALLRLGAVVLFVTPCVDVGLALHTCLADGAYAPFAATAPFVVLSCAAALWALVRLVVDGSRTKYMRLHLCCVAAAAAALALAIALGLTLGPRRARRVARNYDDGDNSDQGVFRTAAYVRCGLLAAVLLTLALGLRLRAAAGAPPPRGAIGLGPRGENPMSARDLVPGAEA